MDDADKPGPTYTEVVVCIGPPRCLFEDDDAVENAQAGCPLCRRILYSPTGAFVEEYKLKAN